MKHYFVVLAFIAIQYQVTEVIAQSEPVSCVTPSDSKGGGGFTPSGSGKYVVQGSHSCGIAADVNSGISAGHALTPAAGTPTGAADAVAACLKREGYYNPSSGVRTEPGYAGALCRCNRLAFSQAFHCTIQSFSGPISAGDINNLNEKLKQKCIVILNIEFSKPDDPNGKPRSRHAVGFAGGMVGPDGGVGLDITDPNSPDNPFRLDADPNSDEIDLIGPYGFMMGYRHASVLSVILKCPEVERPSVSEFTPKSIY